MHAKVINQPDYNEYIIFYLSNIYFLIINLIFLFIFKKIVSSFSKVTI